MQTRSTYSDKGRKLQVHWHRALECESQQNILISYRQGRWVARLSCNAALVCLPQGGTMKCESILPVQESKMKHERVVVVPQLMSTVKGSSTNPVGLTEREVKVLDLVAQGLTNAQIAKQLIVSVHTVNAHMRSIFNKLEVNSRSAATRTAIEQHII